MKKIWGGATTASGRLLWPGIERGADLGAFSGTFPFPIPGRAGPLLGPTWTRPGTGTALTYAELRDLLQ